MERQVLCMAQLDKVLWLLLKNLLQHHFDADPNDEGAAC